MHDDHHESRGTDVLLGARVDESELRHRYGARQNGRGHVGHQRHPGGVGDVRKFHPADGLVGRVMHVSRPRTEAQRLGRRHGGVARRRLVGCDVDLARQALSLEKRLLRPRAGVQVIDARVRTRDVHRDGGELAGCAALQEQHLVVRGDREQLAQQLLGFLSHAGEGLAAMAHFHHRHAAALPVGELLADLFEDFHGQRGRPRSEIEYAHEPSSLRPARRHRPADPARAEAPPRRCPGSRRVRCRPGAPPPRGG